MPALSQDRKNLNVFARKLNGTKQDGKAFTVYFVTVPAKKRAARDLHAVLREHGVERQGLGIFGDRQLGTTGRLFYRYDEDGKGNRRRNDGRYMPPAIRRDPLKPLSGSLQ